MDESQGVCCWGASIKKPGSHDPPISEGVEDETTRWHPVQKKCSFFLTTMLHHQAVSGGFPHCFSDFIDESNSANVTFNANEWKYYGELKGKSSERGPTPRSPTCAIHP
jgi:hypothetical protein